ncbi:hypothetical protein [Leptospira interrogans]
MHRFYGRSADVGETQRLTSKLNASLLESLCGRSGNSASHF